MKITHKKWYAVMRDNDDNDWGYGSHNKSVAAKMLRELRCNGEPSAFIAVIDEVYVDGELNDSATVCIGRIEDVRGI